MKTKKDILFKYLYKVHIYGGLFSAVFLLIAGLSVLNFNHQFFPEKETDTISYEANIAFDTSLNADTLARFITQELGIKGHTPPWDFREDKQGNFRFKIHRPARQYEVKLNRNSDNIKVNEIHFSTGRILRALHFGSISELKDFLLKLWSIYAQLAGLFALIAVATSIYFWFKKSIKNKRQWYAVVASGLVTIIFILHLWLIG